MSTTQLVRDAFEAFSNGDLDALAAAFAPDAKWRAVEDGPRNCHSRDAILARMRENLAHGVFGRVEDLTEEGQSRDRRLPSRRAGRAPVAAR